MATFVRAAPTVFDCFWLVQCRQPEMWHSVFFATALAVGLRSAELTGAGLLISTFSRPAVVLAREGEGGAHYHWKLSFTTPPPTPDGLEQKMRRLWTFCFAIPPPQAVSPPPPPRLSPPLSHSPNPHSSSHCDICEARSPHNKNTLGKCLGSNVCLNWPDESHLDWVCAILLATKYSDKRGSATWAGGLSHWQDTLPEYPRSGTMCAMKWHKSPDKAT